MAVLWAVQDLPMGLTNPKLGKQWLWNSAVNDSLVGTAPWCRVGSLEQGGLGLAYKKVHVRMVGADGDRSMGWELHLACTNLEFPACQIRQKSGMCCVSETWFPYRGALLGTAMCPCVPSLP